MANAKKYPYLVISEYIDKNTGERHKVGETVNLTKKRAEEILAYRRQLIKSVTDEDTQDGETDPVTDEDTQDGEVDDNE